MPIYGPRAPGAGRSAPGQFSGQDSQGRPIGGGPGATGMGGGKGGGWGPAGSIRTRPGMVGAGGGEFGLPQYQSSRIGNQVGNELWNPETESFQRTGAQKGYNAGEALKALQEASGLNLLGSYSSEGGGGAGGGALPRVSMPDTSAARAAAFGRAKDQAGQTARAAITGLRGEMAGRGLLGSGIEGGETANIVGRAAGGVQEVTREQAIQDALAAGRAGEVGYQGDITQRGQDLATRQAEEARRAQAMQGLLSVINSSGMLY